MGVLTVVVFTKDVKLDAQIVDCAQFKSCWYG
jgi:hypothetical protein